MSELRTVFAARAKADRSAAAEEALDNVRGKHLASAAAWDALATTAGKTEEAREKRLSDQADLADAKAREARLLLPSGETLE
jgi:hypothetical protein